MSSSLSKAEGRKRKAGAVPLPHPIRVSIKGMQLSYTYLAAVKFFENSPGSTEIVSNKSVQDVFDSVIREDCSYGLVPLESSSFGTIHTVYDRLLGSNGQLRIIGEMSQIEQYCLCVKAGVEAKDIDVDKVISHPHILECCSEYFKSLDARRQAVQKGCVESITVWDSAAGCEIVAKSAEVNMVQASICTREAADKHGLRVVVDGVGNDRNAETRYIVIAKCQNSNPGTSFIVENMIDPLCVAEPISSPRSGNSNGFVHPAISGNAGLKSSIALALRNVPGAIFKMASCFAFRNIDITKIESRPANVAMQLSLTSPDERPFTQRHWDLIFYIDFEPSEQTEVNESLFHNLQEYCVWYRVLGVYRSGLNTVATQPAEWTTMVDTLAC